MSKPEVAQIHGQYLIPIFYSKAPDATNTVTNLDDPASGILSDYGYGILGMVLVVLGMLVLLNLFYNRKK